MQKLTMTSSLPRSEVLGFKDISGQGQPIEIINLPIYIPLLPLFTEWGEGGKLVNGSGFTALYGQNSLSHDKPYASHQSVIAQDHFALGGMAIVERLEAEGAEFSRTRIWLDYVPAEVVQYNRNPDGTFARDSNGDLVPTGTRVTGIKARFVATSIDLSGQDGIGKGQAREGGLVGLQGVASTMIPFLDIEARFNGKKGDNYGFRLSAPTLMSSIPVNADLVEEQGGAIYRFYAASRVDEFSSGTIFTNLDGEQYTEFSLKTGLRDPKTGIKYGQDGRLKYAFENRDPRMRARFSPFRNIHFYKAGINTALEAVYANEQTYGTVHANQTPEQVINLLTGQNVEGIPYYSYDLLGPADNPEALLMGEATTIWMRDGADGDTSPEAYDQKCRELFANFGDGAVNYRDHASFPMSSVIDSGWNLETTKQLANVMTVRPDVWVAASTQAVADGINTPAEDSSIGAILVNTFQLAPESEHYGTPACRAVVLKHAGSYMDSDYEGVLPFTVAFAKRCSEYMGQGPRMRSGYAFDEDPYNLVAGFVEHNAIFRPVTPRNKDWQTGLIHAQPSDAFGGIHWPGLQTIYTDNTSVLNAFFPMAICCHLTRIGEDAWRRFTGNSRLTAGQFVDRVDRFIESQIQDRYDTRADITPKSYYTPADAQRGYSYHTDITGLFNTMKTVQTLTIVAGRQPIEAEAA